MDNTYYLKVALNVPLLTTFDYILSSDISPERIKAGQRVEVPFRKQKKVGIILAITSKTTLATHKLKTISRLIDDQPIIDNTSMQLAYWLSDYYHKSLGEVFTVLLPTRIRQGKALSLPTKEIWYAKATDASAQLKRAPKQQRAFEIIQQYPDGLTRENFNALDISLPIANALSEKALLIKKVILPQEKNSLIHPSPVTLNTEQQNILEQMHAELNHYVTWVLDGVTGSGKTEIYLQMITAVIHENKQSLVLVPEIGLTPQTIARFSSRFDTDIVVLHSALSDIERAEAWLKAKLGIAKIIIGTRSAIFTPTKNLALIIVDEAHDVSFKQQESLRYHARDVAVKRAQLENIPIILGSATHSLETLYNAQTKKFKQLHLYQRAGYAVEPQYTLLDIRNHYLKEGISPEVLEAIAEKLKAKEQVLIFLNRRGYAPAYMCHHCGWVAECQRCDARMTYHLEPLHLHCHHCDSTKPLYQYCPKCQSHNLLAIGLGTVKIEKVLNDIFPKATLVRVDKDSTRKKNAMDQHLEMIQSGKVDILIGTQMLAKGHHFPNVTLVIILDGDSGFFSSDFRATEAFAQTLMQVAGRAGREEKPGTVMIQTRNPDHPQLQTLVYQGYPHFVNEILKEREIAKLPPYSFLSLIRANAKNNHQTHEFLNQVKALSIKSHTPDISILGPIDAPMPKRAGNYHSQLLFQANNRMQLKQFLSQLVNDIYKLENINRVRWSLDVDPTDLMG